MSKFKVGDTVQFRGELCRQRYDAAFDGWIVTVVECVENSGLIKVIDKNGDHWHVVPEEYFIPIVLLPSEAGAEEYEAAMAGAETISALEREPRPYREPQ